jgi:hypothetical protein
MATWHQHAEPGGGLWIKEELKKFALSVKDRDGHMTSTMDVLANPGEVSVAVDNYNHQFFGETLTLPARLFPICGFISVAVMKAFEEVDEILLKGKMTYLWIASILQNANINELMRGFYFKMYCLHFTKVHIRNLFANRKGFSAAKDNPDSSVVASADNINAIYWPPKWNLRYVNMLVRFRWKVHCLSRTSHHRVQVTLQNPQDQLNSLRFFTHHPQRANPRDFELEHGDVKFELQWFLPATARPL